MAPGPLLPLLEAPVMTGPAVGSPPRLPGSVRRSSSLDLTRPWGPEGPLVVTGRGRDLATGFDGSAAVVGNGLLSATVAKDATISAVNFHPDGDRASRLAGRKVAAGYRTAVWRELRDHYDAGTVLHQLLDELPVGLIIAGFTYRRSLPRGLKHEGRRIGVCAGWAEGSTAARIQEAHGAPPHLDTPHAPPLVSAEDPRGWHSLPELPVWGISRRRRLDVWRDEAGIRLDGMFRDSYVDADGTEKVLHEFGASGTVDPGTGAMTTLEATPRVLPHDECPLSALSTSRVVGATAARFREVVSMEMFGPATCTHLNDLLRSLADAPALARHLPTN